MGNVRGGIYCSYISFCLLISIALLSCNTDVLSGLRSKSGGSNITTVAPAVESVTSTSATSVRVIFSEDIELTSANTAGNYSVPGLTVSGGVRESGNFSIVDLTTSQHDDINYTLTVTGVRDLDNNTIGGSNTGVFSGDVVPSIQNVFSYDNTTVIINFSETVEQSGAQTAVNYSFDNGLTVVSAVRDALNYSKIIITTSSQTGGTGYRLTVNSISDITGNIISQPNYEDFTGTGATDTTGPHVISAALVDSNTVALQFSEAVDLTKAQDTGNYTLKDNEGNGLSINGATRQSDQSLVYIDISTAFSGAIYVLVAGSNITDLAGNAQAGSPYNTAVFNGSGSVPETLADGPLTVDPFNDGSAQFSFMTSYRGRVYIGPSNGDDALFRVKPDGSDPEIVTFAFHGKTAETTTLSPGSDGETGIAFCAGGTIDGTEYLFIGPSKADDWNFIYYTTDTGSVLDLEYLNLTDISAGRTMSLNSMYIFNNNLFIGCSDDGGSKPFLARVLNIVQEPVTDTDIISLDAAKIPYLGKSASEYANDNAAILGIDSMFGFGGQIYFASGGDGSGLGDVGHNGGIVRSNTNDPVPYVDGSNWTTMTPDGITEWHNVAAYDRFSIPLTQSADLKPSHRAFPAMAVFNGSLYVIRNTQGVSGGPQLWKYDGSTWSLVADNGTGITDMGNSNNEFFSLLVVNGERLYIGYDNSTNGINLWRTKDSVTDPALESDFEAVSTDGFGDSANNQVLYHSLSVSSGGTAYLWLLSGKSGQSLRIYRTKNQ